MKLLSIFVWILIAVTSQVNAQNKLAVEKIPLNRSVLHGKLANGLTYYILKDKSNNDKTSMRLVVDAGNPDQDPDQAEMAHLVEHLAFRATENFPMGVMAYFQSKGLVAGKDINAMTINTTNYMLEIPFSDTSLINKGLIALRDWAGGISFLPKELEEERSAVYREGSNANNPSFISLKNMIYRILDSNQLYKSDLQHDMQNVMKAPKETLLRFYRDWYHPMHQAVFITSNIDEREIEKKIKGYFSSLTNTGAREKKAVEGDVPLNGENRLFISDRGAGSPDIEINVYKKRKSDQISGDHTTVSAYKAMLADELINKMIQFRKKRRDRTSVNTTIRIDREPFHVYAKIEAIVAYAVAKQAQFIEPVISQIFTDLKRMGKYGFSEDELRQAKESLMSEIPLDGSSIERLVSYHLKTAPFPDDEAVLKASVLEQITVSDINKLIMEWLGTDDNIDIVFTTSGSGIAGLPSEQKVFSWVNNALQSDVSSYVTPKLRRLSQVPDGAYIKNAIINQLPHLEGIEVLLQNGVKVILKSTASKTDKTGGSIVLKAICSNVISEVKNLKSNQSVLRDLRHFIGADSLNAEEVNHWKKEKKGDLAPYISTNQAGIDGLGDAESLLQLIYFYVTKASIDRAAFTKYIELAKWQTLEKKDVILSFNDSIEVTVKGSSASASNAYFANLDPDEIFRVYQKQFGNPADFTFIVTGSFDQNEMLKLVARYLGALPKSSATIISKPVKVQNVRPVNLLMNTKTVVIKGDSVGNVQLSMLFQGKCEPIRKNNIHLRVLQSALNSLIHTRLREKEKGVYFAMTNLKRGGYDREIFLDVSFQTAPEDIDRLMAAVKDELRKVANGKLEDSTFLNAVADVRVQISEELSKLNAPTFWANYLGELVRKGNYRTESFTDLDVLNAIQPEDLSKAVKTWLNIEEYKLFKLL